MHLSELFWAYWWVVIVAMIAIIGLFVVVAGRNTEGGFGDRTRHGWSRWKAVSDKVANGQARVLLTVFYFTLAAPFGAWQAFISDRLTLRKPSSGSFWVDRSTRDRSLDDARKQF